MINSKKKGSTFELKIAKEMSQLLGAKFCRTPGSGAFGTINQVASLQGDIICSDETFAFPYFLELKKYKEINFWENIQGNKTAKINGWLDKIQEQQTDNVKGVLIFAEDRKKPIVFTESTLQLRNRNSCLYIRNDVVYQVLKLEDWYTIIKEELL